MASSPEVEESSAFARKLLATVGSVARVEGAAGEEVDDFFVRWNSSQPRPGSRRVETVMICGDVGTGKTRLARLMWAHRAWCLAEPKLRGQVQVELDRLLAEHRDPIAILGGALGDKLAQGYGWRQQPLPNMTESLFDSLLFGYAKGAFTDAKADMPGVLTCPEQKGRAKRADVFLDEVTEIGSALQAKLLGVLSTGEFRPVGAENSLPLVDRLVFASNRQLATAVGQTFRLDLYHRIATPCITMRRLEECPPEDFKRIVHHLVVEIEDALGVPPGAHITDEDLDELRKLRWPGNVRQLENVLEDFVRSCAAGKTSRRPQDVAVQVAKHFEPQVDRTRVRDVTTEAQEWCRREFDRLRGDPAAARETPASFYARFVEERLPRDAVSGSFVDVFRDMRPSWVSTRQWQKHKGSRPGE